jgi:hypothetical protein
MGKKPSKSRAKPRPAQKQARRSQTKRVTWRSSEAEREPHDAAPHDIAALELSQPMADAAAAIKWAKGIVAYAPDDVRHDLNASIEALTEEQTGWMRGFDDYEQERDKAANLIAYAVEVGFGLALARFREPLTRHAPEARNMIIRLDDNRRKGTAATKAKPAAGRDALRRLMAAAAAERREVSPEEVMRVLKCSRTTAWRRMTEIQLGD